MSSFLRYLSEIEPNDDDDQTPAIDVPPPPYMAWLDNPLVNMHHPETLAEWPSVRVGGPLYRSMVRRGWIEDHS